MPARDRVMDKKRPRVVEVRWSGAGALMGGLGLGLGAHCTEDGRLVPNAASP